MKKEQIDEIALRVYSEEVAESGYHPIRSVRMFSTFLAELAKEPVAWLRADGDDVVLVKWLSKQPEFIQRNWQKQIPVYTLSHLQPDLVAEQQAHIEFLRLTLEHYAKEDIRNARHYPPEYAKEALAATPKASLREHDAQLVERIASDEQKNLPMAY